MKDKYKANRKDYSDSIIQDALDICDYNIKKAADHLAIHQYTLRNWINKSPELSNYISFRRADHADRARDKLLELIDSLDPERASSSIVSACKILMDKYEPDLSKSEVDNKVSIDTDLEDKIKKLLGD